MGNNMELEARIMCSAIQSVFHQNGIMLRQMAPNRRTPPKEEHTVAIGDTVVTIGSTPENFSDWKKAVQLEEQVAARIAEYLNIRGLHSEQVGVKLSVHNNMILTEITRPNPELLTWAEIEKHAEDSILIGRDIRRKPVFLDLEDSAPGILVTGTSGAGKSNLMRLITAQAAKQDVECYLACLKGPRDWKDLIPLAKMTAFNNEDGSRMLDEVHMRVIKRNNERESIEVPILLVWDEIALPITDERNQVKLGALAKICRSSNVILLAGTQTAGTDVNASVRDNLKHRMAFKTQNPNLSYMNTGRGGMGAEKLAFYEMLFVQDGFEERVSIPRADSQDIARLIKPEIKELMDTNLKTPGQLLANFARRDLEEDNRRVPPIKEAAWAMVFYWRRGVLPDRNTLTAISRAREGYKISLSKYNRIMRFLKDYHDYVQSQGEEYINQHGGVFAGNTLSQTHYKRYIPRWGGE